MPEFKDSSLWQKAFGKRKNDHHSDSRDIFRQNYIDLRERASAIITSIPQDIPGLTVHDITHSDALWEIASTIAGENYPVNPAEGYVLGAAMLLHDATMTLLAYPNGLEELQNTSEWRDTVTAALREQGEEHLTEEQVKNPPDSVREAAISEVLRVLHAKRATELPFRTWPGVDGNAPAYLIQNSELRSFYGRLIGKIAYSHHASVSQLDQLLGKPINAFSRVPREWTVDPIKLACLLRCADAAHIDERRAPNFLYALRRVEGVSADHWNFQGKIGKPRLEGDALVFSSGPEFNLQDADAWWLCFDTVRMIDRELHDTDLLLEEVERCPRFAARRVKGAETPRSLAAFIRTQGWEPVDTHLRVSDVPGLVRLLGGAHLYGNDQRIPIRELVQNAADAIRARRLMESRPDKYGCVRISLTQRTDGMWLDVEDDGIGMSQRTMADALLDFGTSFWAGDAVRQEFPGLVAKGMTATGRFGIGFFSVFMLGEFVRVASRRFDAALESTKALEFRTCLEVRPILRQALPEECLQNGGTRVSVRLKLDPYAEGGLLAHSAWGEKKRIGLPSLVGAICPNIDANLIVEEEGTSVPCIRANDWLRMNGSSLFSRLRVPEEHHWQEKGIGSYSQNLRILTDKAGKVHGRAAILGFDNYYWEHYGCVTVGGLAAARLDGIGGILLGTVQTVARNVAIPTVPRETLANWATVQAQLIAASSLSPKEKHRAAGVVMQCGGDPGELPFVIHAHEYLNRVQIEELLREKEEIVMFEHDEVEYDEDADDCLPRDFKEKFEPDKELMFVSDFKLSILTIGNQAWPQMIFREDSSNAPKTYSELIRSVVRTVWGPDFDESTDIRLVGGVGGFAEIEREVTILTRPTHE